jgi:hypothetical protein
VGNWDEHNYKILEKDQVSKEVRNSIDQRISPPFMEPKNSFPVLTKGPTLDNIMSNLDQSTPSHSFL